MHDHDLDNCFHTRTFIGQHAALHHALLQCGAGAAIELRLLAPRDLEDLFTAVELLRREIVTELYGRSQECTSQSLSRSFAK